MSAQHVNRKDVEARIMKLCERARAKGWRFSRFNPCRSGSDGCALQACGSELGTSWSLAAFDLGISPASFGYGFDHATLGLTRVYQPFSSGGSRADYKLGVRVARRLTRLGSARADSRAATILQEET